MAKSPVAYSTVLPCATNKYSAICNKWPRSPIEKLHIIGGGSRNNLLNQFTCNAVGVPVIAGPSEGTAIGNIMLQAKANGLVSDIAAMRQLISTSIETVSFEPQQAEEWEEAYKKYLAHYREDI